LVTLFSSGKRKGQFIEDDLLLFTLCLQSYIFERIAVDDDVLAANLLGNLLILTVTQLFLADYFLLTMHDRFKYPLTVLLPLVGFKLLAGILQKKLISHPVSQYSLHEIEVFLANDVQLLHNKTQAQLLGNVVVQVVFQIFLAHLIQLLQSLVRLVEIDLQFATLFQQLADLISQKVLCYSQLLHVVYEE